MRVIVTPPAEEELFSAFSWYQGQEVGLGLDLYDEFEMVMERVLRHPLSAKPARHSVRQTSLERFPYSVFYSIESDEIVVHAFVHHRRQPFYWIDRLK